jgi:hypothetical protein
LKQNQVVPRLKARKVKARRGCSQRRTDQRKQSFSPRSDIGFNSDGSSSQQESAAKRNHHKSRPIRFDAEAAAGSFRFQRVSPERKSPYTA